MIKPEGLHQNKVKPRFHLQNRLFANNFILGDPEADSGGEGKSKRAVFGPFRLSLVPTICPWVSEDGLVSPYFQTLGERSQ